MASHQSTPIFVDEYLETSQFSIDCASDTDDVDEMVGEVAGPVWIKDYSSETDSPMQELGRKGGLLDRPPADGSDLFECKLLIRPGGMGRRIAMDMEEIKACRDLGFAFPCDWKVEISGGGFDTSSSSGVNSPSSDWSISSPGDDPTEIKARLKVWAQAVALASVNLNSD